MVGLHFNDGWWTEVVHVTTQHLVNGAKDCWSKVLPSALRVSRCLPQIVLQTVLFFCPILAQFCCNLFFPIWMIVSLFSYDSIRSSEIYFIYNLHISTYVSDIRRGRERSARSRPPQIFIGCNLEVCAGSGELPFFGQFWRWKSSPFFIFATLYTHIPMHRQIFYTTLEKLNICKIYYIYSSNLYHMYIYM